MRFRPAAEPESWDDDTGHEDMAGGWLAGWLCGREATGYRRDTVAGRYKRCRTYGSEVAEGKSRAWCGGPGKREGLGSGRLRML